MDTGSWPKLRLGGGGGCWLRDYGAGAAPHQLEAGEDGNYGNGYFQFARGDFAGEEAAHQDSGDAARQKLLQDRAAD